MPGFRRTVPKLALLGAAILLLHGCAKREDKADQATGDVPAILDSSGADASARTGAPASAARESSPGEIRAVSAKFADRKWRVVSASTSIAPGTIYEFRSDGKLVITSPGSPPMEGTWGLKNGSMTMVEDGIPYKVDIVTQTPREFKIRSHNPGGVVEIRLVPAGA